MKKIISFLLAILLTGAAFSQSTEQALSEKVKVTFPGKPNIQKLDNGATVYTNAKDSTTSYMGMGIDLTQFGLTAETIATMGDGLWEQMKGPMLAQMPGAVVVKDEITNFKGKSALYLEIDGAKSTAPLLKGKKIFGYAFFVDAMLHQVMYYSTAPAAKMDDAKPFFDSVTIK